MNQRNASDQPTVMLLLPPPENLVAEKTKPKILPSPKVEPEPPAPDTKAQPRIVAAEPLKTVPAPILVPAKPAEESPVTNNFAATRPVEVYQAPPDVSEKTVENVRPQTGQIVRAQPRYRENPQPIYPAQAKRRRQEGSVLLDASVDESGKTTRVALKQSSGFSSLDEAAIEAVRRWQFEPAKLGERPVESSVEIPISFKLSK